MYKRCIILLLMLSIVFCYNSDLVYASGTDLTDVMKNWDGYENADTEVVSEDGFSTVIVEGIGIVTSIIIYLLFFANFIQTVIDLLYVVIPPLRVFLYDYNTDSSNVNIHTSVMHGIAENEMGKAQMYAMQGDMNKANKYINMAQMHEAEGQYRDENWFGNKERMKRAEDKASEGGKKVRCFVSDDLKSLVRQGQINITTTSGSAPEMGKVGIGTVNKKSNMLCKYFKKRSITMVLLTTIVILLISSGIFLETGFNVGKAVLKILGVA